MKSTDVAEVLDVLERIQVRAWVDGGWGVDALVGRETRRHADLDLALDRGDLASAMAALAEIGFTQRTDRTPGAPARYVVADALARQVDLHPLMFDADGNGWQQLAESGKSWGCYPRDGLRAEGTIAGRQVACLTAELQLRFHKGYQHSATDRHDRALLAERSSGEPVEALRTEMAHMYLETLDGLAAIPDTWREFEMRLGSLRGRHFFGTFAAGRYRAGVEAVPDDDPQALGLRTGTVPGGRYLRLRLTGEPPTLYTRIPAAFAALESAGVRDQHRPSIEWYRSRDRVDLLLPILEEGPHQQQEQPEWPRAQAPALSSARNQGGQERT